MPSLSETDVADRVAERLLVAEHEAVPGSPQGGSGDPLEARQRLDVGDAGRRGDRRPASSTRRSWSRTSRSLPSLAASTGPRRGATPSSSPVSARQAPLAGSGTATAKRSASGSFATRGPLRAGLRRRGRGRARRAPRGSGTRRSGSPGRARPGRRRPRRSKPACSQERRHDRPADAVQGRVGDAESHVARRRSRRPSTAAPVRRRPAPSRPRTRSARASGVGRASARRREAASIVGVVPAGRPGSRRRRRPCSRCRARGCGWP